MFPSRSFLRRATSLRLARTEVARDPSASRHGVRRFGTKLGSHGSLADSAFASSALKTLHSAGYAPDGGLATVSTHLGFCLGQVRHASTQPSSPATNPFPTVNPGSGPLPQTNDFGMKEGFSSTLELTGSQLIDMPEHVGYLKAMGLDYGWGPTSLMQWSLEHVYIYTGLPWWGSMVVLAIAFRAALFVPTLRSQEGQHKIQLLRKNPAYAAAEQDMKMSMVTGDRGAGMRGRAIMQQFEKEIGLSRLSMFIPLLQVPLQYGMFKLLRGMASLPVPSLEEGGVLWFTNLVTSDPLYVLPVAAAGAMYFNMRVGLQHMPPGQRKLMRTISYVVLPLGGLISISFPAGLQLWFALSGLTHALQSYFFYQPWFRTMYGLPPLASAAARPSPVRPFEQMGAQYQSPNRPNRVVTTTARPATEVKESAKDGAEDGDEDNPIDDIKHTLQRGKDFLKMREEKAAIQSRVELKKELKRRRKSAYWDEALARMAAKKNKSRK